MHYMPCMQECTYVILVVHAPYEVGTFDRPSMIIH